VVVAAVPEPVGAAVPHLCDHYRAYESSMTL